MAAKKVEMTPEIKTKLKRDLRSFLQPLKITIELEDELDHVIEIERLTNREMILLSSAISTVDNSEIITSILNITEEIIVPKIKSWTNDGEDYTKDKETLIKYVKADFLIDLFSKIQVE